MRIPLTQLDPRLLRVVKHKHWQEVDHLHEAQGIRFLCPVCFEQNHGPVGTHCVVVWFRSKGVPDNEEPVARWELVSGSGPEDLVLSPSILLRGEGCGWHGYVGQVAPGIVS